MDAIEAMQTRRSIRAFKREEVPKEVLKTIIDAGRLAATARNEQPWEFVVVSNENTRQHLAVLAEYGKFIAEAPICIVVLCKDTKYYLEDGSAATQNLLLAAHALGVGSCWVAGDKKPYADDVRKAVGGPEGYKLISMVALGYPEKSTDPPPKRDLKEVLHWEEFAL